MTMMGDMEVKSAGYLKAMVSDFNGSALITLKCLFVKV